MDGSGMDRHRSYVSAPRSSHGSSSNTRPCESRRRVRVFPGNPNRIVINELGLGPPSAYEKRMALKCVSFPPPLGPAEWSFLDSPNGPSLAPSIGNWQFPCRSHYWIQGGQVVWSAAWTPTQVQAGHRAEEERRRAITTVLNEAAKDFSVACGDRSRAFSGSSILIPAPPPSR